MSIIVLVLILLVISFLTLISQCPKKVSKVKLVFNNYFLTFLIAQINKHFEHLSAKVHGNRCTGQIVSFLVVCVIKAVAVTTIVSFVYFLNELLPYIPIFHFAVGISIEQRV